MHGRLWEETVADREKFLGRWEDCVREGVDLLGADTPAGMRMAETAAFFEFMRKEMPAMLERWREVREGLRSGAEGSRR